jgi:4-amino-4-deoxy-L-arabinose transferase-like glycosyltransferase
MMLQVSPRAAASRVDSLWPLLALLILAGVLRVIFFAGLVASDDTAYAYWAISMLNGSFEPGASMTAMRIALDAAAAVSFGLFGVSEWALGLPALTASLLTLVIIYLIAFMVGGRVAALVAGLLYAVSPLNILESSALLPEVPMGFFVALGVFLFILGLRAAPSRAAIALTLGSGLAIGVGYLVKEPAALMLGAFVLIGLARLARGDRHAWLYALPVAGFAALFTVETVLYWVSSGELLHRFRFIARFTVAAALDFEKERRAQSFWLYPRSMFFVVTQVGLLFYLLCGGAALALLKRWRTPWLVVLWLVIPFLYLQFGSTSLTSYIALPKQPRYLEALTAPAVILVGVWATECFRSSGLLGRRMAYAALGLYVFTAPLFTTVSFIDHRAVVQPIRDVATFLVSSRLQPVYATSTFTNGFWFWSVGSSAPEVSRVCVGCVAGPCSLAAPSRVGEVWAIPQDAPPAPLPAATDCARWRPAAEVPVTLPATQQDMIRVLLAILDRLPLPRAVGREVRPLRGLLEAKYVTVNQPSEAP